jgi:polyisoprenoid-binding protein YceI
MNSHPGERAKGLAVAAMVAAGAVTFDAAREAQAAPTEFVIDPAHFSVGFLVDHIGYAKVLGMFLQAGGSFTFDEEALELSDVRIVIQADSVFTNDEERDNHLRSPDFLNAAEFPEIVFVGREPERLTDTTGRLTGDLTLLGITRPVTVDLTFNKSGRYPFGGGLFSDPPYAVGISARTSFQRSDFGMTYAVENGWVGDAVELILEFEAVRQ